MRRRSRKASKAPDLMFPFGVCSTTTGARLGLLPNRRFEGSPPRSQNLRMRREASTVFSILNLPRPLVVLVVGVLSLLGCVSPPNSPLLVSAANYNDDYGGGSYSNNKNSNYNQNYNDDSGQKQNDNTDDYYNDKDDAGAYSGDDSSGGSSSSSSNYNNKNSQGNDDYYSRNQQYYANGDDSSSYQKEQQQYQNKDDDVFHWDTNAGFEGVSVMPLSCINYNNGHMIKFQLFDKAQSHQCHFAEISTFVVSVAHYMRAYFNYQALTKGSNFKLPGDASLLSCMQLQSVQLYVKIGCMERETFTSTKLQLRVYTDAQCSQPYDDGQTARQHATKGYKIGDGFLESKVSFRPPFYSCLSCAPDAISDTFNKKSGYWYDDDYISRSYNKNSNKNKNNNNNNNNNNDDYGGSSSYSNKNYDDQYMAANDDVKYDDAYRSRSLATVVSLDDIQAFEKDFWDEVNEQQSRQLYDNYYDIGNWNLCQRIYKYGMWCDSECRSLDFFRTDQWSASDVFLLVVMCVFMTAMMLLIVAKRLKAQQKARIYGEEKPPMPGLPPVAMSIIFLVILAVIIALAKLKFINETLVFAVVTCILLFIYMLKLTLFENRRPVLLAAPRHELFDRNPLDDHLFD